MGFGPRDINQHHRQDWNVLTQLGSLAFHLCHWPEKTLPEWPRGSSGLTGDMWGMYVRSPSSAEPPAKPSLDSPIYRLLSKRSASRTGHRFCSCCSASLWPQFTEALLGTVRPWAIPCLPIPDSSSIKWGRGGRVHTVSSKGNWGPRNLGGKELQTPGAQVSSGLEGGAEESAPLGTAGKQQSLYPNDMP